MMSETNRIIQCRISKPLPIDRLRQKLSVQLWFNGMPDALHFTQGSTELSFGISYRNCDLGSVKQTVQMICDMTDIELAREQGHWNANYPPVQIEWTR